MRAQFTPFTFAAAAFAALGLAFTPAPARAELLPHAASPNSLVSPYGEYFLVGGGVTDFTKSETSDRFDVGGSWDVRLGFGSRSYVGAELAYVGAARQGTNANPDLYMNGGEAVLRLQYPYVAGKWLVEPFAFGGVGWSHLTLDNAPAGLDDSDDIGIAPFGGGVSVGYGRFLFDARFTYRAAWNENLALAVNQAAPSMNQWGVTASIGYEF